MPAATTQKSILKNIFSNNCLYPIFNRQKLPRRHFRGSRTIRRHLAKPGRETPRCWTDGGDLLPQGSYGALSCEHRPKPRTELLLSCCVFSFCYISQHTVIITPEPVLSRLGVRKALILIPPVAPEQLAALTYIFRCCIQINASFAIIPT